MDILKEFKEFLLNGGLKNLIHDFRNPSLEQQIHFDTKYISDKDIQYNEWFDEVKQEQADFVTPFTSVLNSKLKDLKTEISKRISDLKSIRDSDSNHFYSTLENSKVDFVSVRRLILDDADFNKYSQILLAFVNGIDAAYREINLSDGRANKTTGKKDSKKSFGFTGEESVLKIIYKFKLEDDDFIDKEKTKTVNEFISVLKAEDYSKGEEVIKFNCDTKQAVYILIIMQKFFSNLKGKSIGESKKFLTKEGEPLTENNFNVSGNKARKNSFKQKDTIDAFFQKLK